MSKHGKGIIKALKEYNASIRPAGCRCSELREALEEIMPPANTPDDQWWCPTCKDAVPGTHVTFESRHEVCGTYLDDCQPSDKWEKIRGLLSANAEGGGE